MPEKEKKLKSTADMPLINITGEKTALGPYRRDLIDTVARWMNDFEVAILSGDPLRPTMREYIEAEYEQIAKESPHRSVNFIIYERVTWRAIGLTELRHINQKHGSAELGILIGEKDCWGKGYGTEATVLILDYGFTVMGLHNIMLETFSYNERAVRTYRRAGFREIGRRRESVCWGDRRYDIILMDCLSSEFQSTFFPAIHLPE
jgi:diamine N-acetyltransferase